ncbi:MAG TPA: hypothetical protein VLT34_03690 [Arthrobacter sp.]|nr:hypothetical protein [Arthrobacter sp.]
MNPLINSLTVRAGGVRAVKPAIARGTPLRLTVGWMLLEGLNA